MPFLLQTSLLLSCYVLFLTGKFFLSTILIGFGRKLIEKISKNHHFQEVTVRRFLGISDKKREGEVGT
jgi:hypothetical protein